MNKYVILTEGKHVMEFPEFLVKLGEFTNAFNEKIPVGYSVHVNRVAVYTFEILVVAGSGQVVQTFSIEWDDETKVAWWK